MKMNKTKVGLLGIMVALVLVGCYANDPRQNNSRSEGITIATETKVQATKELTAIPSDTPVLTPSPVFLEGKVNAESLRVRDNPSMNSKLVGGLLYEEEVVVFGRNNNSE